MTNIHGLPDRPEAPDKISDETYKDFLWSNSIQQGDPDQKKHIAIIGAGISGLVAGWLLKRAGHEVKIFEANNIVGGRIKTLRESFTGSLYAEAGAMRIPNTHHITLDLCRFLGLDFCDFKNQCNNGILYANGGRQTFSNYYEKSEALGFNLANHERGKTAEELFDSIIIAFAKANGMPDFDVVNLSSRSDVKDNLFNKMDELSLRSFLYSKPLIDEDKHLSRAAADMICLALAYEMHLSSSMAAILNDYLELNHTKNFFRLKGGMDLLPRAFVGPIGDNFPDEDADRSFLNETPPQRDNNAPNLLSSIQYNSRVDWIDYGFSPDLRREALKIWSFNTKSNFEQKDEFDICIVALPFSALRSVRTRKGLLSAGKRRAIRQLHYDNSCKVLLEFTHRFWERHRSLPRIQGGKSMTDLLIRQVYYPFTKRTVSRSDRAVLLASYTWGDDSLRWTSLSPENRIRFATRDLEFMHDLEAEELKGALVGGTSHSWAHDEFTSGAFALFEPYQYVDLFEDVWKPDHLLHFCGEHTSTKHGWIEGAIQSGIRVAREVCGRIQINPQLPNHWGET